MVAFAMLIEIVFYVLAANCTGVSDKAIFMTPESFLGSLLSYNPWLAGAGVILSGTEA